MLQQIAIIYSDRCFAPSENATQAVQKKHPNACVWFRKEADVSGELSTVCVLNQEEKTVNAGPYIVRYRLVEVPQTH